MITIALQINKSEVYEEVAKTTRYTGAKMVGDDTAYDRIFTTDEDKKMLERFWIESANGATEQLKPFLSELSDNSETNNAESYSIKLDMSSAFDTTLTGSIQTSLYSYFVMMIVSKWYKFTNKAEAESFATDASDAMDDVMRKLYWRKKPTRVVPA